MCGIVALVRKHPVISTALCDAFEEMWWGLQLRGMDGSGIFQLNKDKVLKMEKSAYTPDYSRFEKPIGQILRAVDESPFTVAHCRGATKRPAKADDRWLKKNAHPFQHGNITLVHNGFFSYVGQSHNEKHEVDSESFTNAVDDLGIDDALKKAFGAYAIVYHDKRDNTLNIARNADRPLFRLETFYGDIYISEPELALWILKRNTCPPPTKVEEVKTKQLITYKPFDLEYTTRAIDDYVDRSSYGGRRKSWWWDLTDDDDDMPLYPRGSGNTGGGPIINKTLSLEQVMEKICRFAWDDSLFFARQRCAPTGWTPQIGNDYKKFLETLNGPTEEIKEPPKKLLPPAKENKVIGFPLLQESVKDGIILGIFHDAFRVTRGQRVIFPAIEIHEHKGFCGIVGAPNNPIARDRVKFIGNFSVPIKELKESKRLLDGEVISINKVKEKGRYTYIVQMGDIKFSGYLDLNKVARDEAKEKQSPKETSEDLRKKTEAALLISKDLDGAPVKLDDVVMCPGCKDLVHKKTIKPYIQHSYKDEEGKMTSSIEIQVCPKCHAEAKENFNAYYTMKFLPSIKDVNKGVQ